MGNALVGSIWSVARAGGLGALLLALLGVSGRVWGQAGPEENGAGASGAGGARRDNVVLVILDDVGIDALGLYAGVNSHRADLAQRMPEAYPRMPHLDSLAAGGVLFTQARVNPTCSATRASILTGRYAFRHGIGSLVVPVQESALARATVAELGVGPGRAEVTLAHLAHAAGYETLYAGKYHLALGTEERALDGAPGSGPRHVHDVAGFDHHWIVWSNLPQDPAPVSPVPPVSNRNRDAGKFPPGYYNFEALRDGVLEKHRGAHATDVVAAEALRLVRAAEDPWFLVLAFNAPHAPYELPPAERVATRAYLELAAATRNVPGAREHQSDWPFYNAMLEALDVALGGFRAGLEADGDLERTWFFVVGDNGTPNHVIEDAVEHNDLPVGKTSVALVRDRRPRFKHSVFEGGVRVPLIVNGPGVANPGRRSDALVDGVDLFATLAQVFGLEPDALGDPERRRDGVSFHPVLVAEAEADRLGARRQSYVERFEPNGDARGLTFEPRDGAPYRAWDRALLVDEPDGRFKLVEFHDSDGEDRRALFQLADAAGKAVDPFELEPLDTASEAGHARLGRLRAALAALLDSEPKPATPAGG